MLTVTKEAANFFKAAKAADGASQDAGIRILRGGMSDDPEVPIIEFEITDDPEPDDQEFEEEGLRIFVEHVLIEPLDGFVLDVTHAGDEAELVLR